MTQRKDKTCQRCGRYIGRGDWWPVSVGGPKKWVICLDCLNDFFSWLDKFGMAFKGDK